MGSHQLEHRRLGGSGFRVIKHAAKTDLQGSVRAVMNNNGVGTSTVIARHDYLPFGEEISSGVGMRTGSQGYNVPDSNRQKYAMLERDSTGLDHTWWRKYESTAGRYTDDGYESALASSNRSDIVLFLILRNNPI